MNILQQAIEAKTDEIERALENQVPHEELLKIYKELKELHYQKVQAEMAAQGYTVE